MNCTKKNPRVLQSYDTLISQVSNNLALKMLVSSIVMTLLLILGLFSSVSSSVANHIYATQMILETDDFRIQNTSSFIDESSILHIYGEIVNTSNRSLSNVTAKGSFYDNNGKPLNEYQRDCELPAVNPGGICPFEILYIDTGTTKAVKDYKLSAVGTPIAKEKPNALKVFSEGSRLDISGFYYINGRILNEGSEMSTLTTVVATLYDKDGKVVALGRALAEPVSISPDNRASFGIAVTEKKQTYKADSYSLVAYSNQYLSSPITVNSK